MSDRVVLVTEETPDGPNWKVQQVFIVDKDFTISMEEKSADGTVHSRTEAVDRSPQCKAELLIQLRRSLYPGLNHRLYKRVR